MKKISVEMTVGIFVLIGIVCVGYLTVRLGKMELLGSNYYTLNARFTSAAGLKSGARVEIAGVQVGTVNDISLDLEGQMALVTLSIRKKIAISEYDVAAIKTSGLIGDKYVSISPGGADEILAAGDEITDTQAPVDLEELISKYVFGGA